MIDETIPWLCLYLYLYENPFGILTLKLVILLYAAAVRGREYRAEEERNFLSIGLRREREVEDEEEEEGNIDWFGKAFI